MERQDKKRFEIMTGKVWCHVTTSCQQIGLVKYYTLYGRVCGIYITGPDTFVASEDYPRVFGKGNPPCNAEDNLHAGCLVIEAWFRGY